MNIIVLFVIEVDVEPITNLDIQSPPAVQLVFVSATIPRSTEETLQELIHVCDQRRDFISFLFIFRLITLIEHIHHQFIV